ncbi:MAG TPA: preprotein translocase subunit SecE [Spirochaetota bacterium]|nr:preprotein translocase subunit SecE [Spirochaetota bacterium]HPC41005.1 preprotein translocase subunit SecE [Spirochaetota bacterium]HPL17588.1 preprotein translocase subunit SecE [Spirochaetota bacterium]HQF08882.1 preprotein translocase subunit SecE [Spirochaetota bacterium]HQH97501.1 preprotein translocase subunit SecE [Spirochaetota bacterium]
MNKILDPISGMMTFVREAKDELKKVTWPTRDEVTSFTMVVVVALLAISLFLWLVDTGLMYLIKTVMK